MTMGDKLRQIAAYVDERHLAGIALVMVGPLRYELVMTDIGSDPKQDAAVLGLSIYQATSIKTVTARELAGGN